MERSWSLVVLRALLSAQPLMVRSIRERLQMMCPLQMAQRCRRRVNTWIWFWPTSVMGLAPRRCGMESAERGW